MATPIGPVGQGTRAFPQQGTINYPRGPIDVSNFSGEKAVVPNWRDTLSRFMPWAIDAVRVLTGSITDGAKTQSIILDINEGPPPRKIARQIQTRNVGSVWENGGAQFPTVNAYAYIPHVDIPRRPMSSVNPRKLTDDKAPIPAVYAGNPRGYSYK